MDKERRSRLKSVVGQARRAVEDDARVQLRHLGIDENEIKPVEKLPHLSAADKELRQKIVEALEKEKAGDISYSEAFDRYVRHVGFTYVNRIAALRAMEVRNLIKETVIRRDVYGGGSRREYELAERERFSDPYELLKAGLVEAFNEVSVEIRVLFDVNSEYSLVFLGHKALLELIRLLGEEVPEEDWKEDDIIGWIYQYYNEEARAEFKKAKRKPKADDIPVINQFYTPRWVVRVLVDNTLGRLWLEMNGRCPKLGDPVKRTKEQLQNPSGDKVDDFCSYLVPLSQEPPPREKKSVREIKVLDPACGSGHFLVYAFDVLFRLYKEDEPDTPVEEIPRLILENNLFGIDIDLRAVQLAALSLYLKAKLYNPRLKITKINLVCADARITDGKVRRVFLERFAIDPELQKIFARIFEDLEYTFEVGSLLKVRVPFERLLERRRKEGMQAILFPKVAGQIVLTREGKLEGQTKLSLSPLNEERDDETIVVSKVTTLDQILEALREFEREAMEKKDMGTLLFAAETEKSLGLATLLSEKYDIVVMNPPYGNVPSMTKEYLRKYYPKTHHDYYAAFMEQAVELTQTLGYVGAIVGRTFMFLKSYRWLREELLKNQALPQIVFDLGFGVLDIAMARWAAFTALKYRSVDDWISQNPSIIFFRLTECKGEEEKRLTFEESIIESYEHDSVYQAKIDSLAKVSDMPYSYWASANLRDLFALFPPLDRDFAGRPSQPKIAHLRQGLATADDARFTRRFWEVPITSIGLGKRWIPFVKGIHAWYDNLDLVVNWEKHGQEIKGRKNPETGLPFSNVWMLQETEKDFFFREGLSWSMIVSSVRLNMHFLPKGCIFTQNHLGLLPVDPRTTSTLCTLLNSSLMAYLSRLLDPLEHTRTQSMIARLPIAAPVFTSVQLATSAHEAHDILREWDTGNETSTVFVKPWILTVLHGFSSGEKPTTGHPFSQQFEWSHWPLLEKMHSIVGNRKMNLRELAGLAIEKENMLLMRLSALEKQIDEEVYRLYDINEKDRKIIESELYKRSAEVPSLEQGEEMEEEREQIEAILDEETHIQDDIARLVSFYIKRILELDLDGIVPIHELLQRLREKLAEDFGEHQADAKEKEIQEILGKNLEDWVVTDYFDFHVNLYKRRPVFWHLTSSNFSTTRGSVGAFNCFVYYHKLDKETIPRIMVNYLRPEVERAKWKVDRLKRELQEARNTEDKRKERQLSEELESALSVLEELQTFEKTLDEVRNPRSDKTKLPKNPTWLQQKIAEVRDNGYNPVKDYGVRVNIEPLKEAGLLHKAAQRVK